MLDKNIQEVGETSCRILQINTIKISKSRVIFVWL